MTSMIRYIFGLIGAMLASLIIYGLFMSGQSNMYTVMNNQLGTEYLMHTGNNGQMMSEVREAAWNADTVEKNFTYIAYNEIEGN